MTSQHTGRHDSKRTQIMDAAKIRIIQDGYKAVTIDAVCQDCGISKKTFYQFFPTKEELFFDLIDRDFTEHVAYLEDPVKDIADPLERIRAFIRMAVSFLAEDPFNINFLTQTNTSGSLQIRERYQRFIQDRCIEVATRYIEYGKSQGLFQGVTDTHIYAYSTVKLFFAFTYMRTIEFDPGKEKSGYYTDVLIDQILHSFGE